MLKLTPEERLTFGYHTLYSFLNGIMGGGLVLQEIIARKTLLSSNLVITFITMVWPVVNLFSIYWGNLIEGRQNRTPLFLLTAFAGRLSLLLTFFVRNGWHLLYLLVLVYSFNAFLIPVQNSIFQVNYREKTRGFLFGVSSSVNSIMVIVTSVIIGKVLDMNEMLFRPIFAVCGIAGFLSVLVLAKIPVKVKPRKKQGEEAHPILAPLLDTVEEFKVNREFFVYEIAFFIYGMGYLLVLPIIPQFLVNKLGMTYTQISFARVFIAQLGMAILLPLAGFFHSKMNPVPYSALCFAVLGLYPLFLALSPFQKLIPPQKFVYFAFGIYSIGMAGIMIVWFLGSIYFARERDAAVLQSVHVTMTGLRGILAPPLGYFLMTKFSDTVGFLTGSALFFIASLILLFMEAS